MNLPTLITARSALRLAIGFGLGVAIVVGAALAGYSPIGSTPTRVEEIALHGLVVRSANAAGRPAMPEAQAEAAARVAGEARFQDQFNGRFAASARELSFSDLVVVESTFVPGALNVKSRDGRFEYKTSASKDLWVVIFRKSGADRAENSVLGEKITVEVQVVLADKDGRLEMSGALVYDENALR